MSAVGDIHRWVPGEEDGARTLLVLHGTGGDEEDLLPLARAIAPGAALLAPRGPVLEGGMPRFFRRTAPGVFDLADLARRTAELGDFLRAAGARYGFDPAEVVALGYSNGANIAASLLLTDAVVPGAAILLRPMLPFEPERLPRRAGTAVYLAAGRRDAMTPPGSVDALADRLRRAGAEVELAWSDGGHGLEASEVEAARRWLEETVPT